MQATCLVGEDHPHDMQDMLCSNTFQQSMQFTDPSPQKCLELLFPMHCQLRSQLLCSTASAKEQMNTHTHHNPDLSTCPLGEKPPHDMQNLGATISSPRAFSQPIQNSLTSTWCYMIFGALIFLVLLFFLISLFSSSLHWH